MKPPPIPGRRRGSNALRALVIGAVVLAMGGAAFFVGLQVVGFVRGFRKGFAEARASRNSGETPSRSFLERDEEEKRDSIEKCISQLKSIQGAKEIWQLEHLPTQVQPAPASARRKRARPPARPQRPAVKQNPDESDLFGLEAYIREKPRCPNGGVYNIGKLDEPPRCTIPHHTLDFGHVVVVDESGQGLADATVTARNAAGDENSFTTGTNGLSSDYFSVGFFRKGVQQIAASLSGYKSATVPFSTNWPARIVLRKEGN